MPVTLSSTYRLQLNANFTFDDAAALAPYLKDLGISHVYCSPYMQAAPGSMHGYDVVDYERVNEELGGEDAHQRFCNRLRELGLGQILDIVPNHMATGSRNRYWWDVLENGPSSRYSTWFDIDWKSPEVKLYNKVLIPVLGDQYGRVLAEKQIQIARTGDRFEVRYFDQEFPLAPHSLAILLKRAADQIQDDTINFLADSLLRLPPPDTTDHLLIQERHRDKDVIYSLLRHLYDEKPQLETAIQTAIDIINDNIDLLDDILNQQNYRLAYWRTADQELGYRRFFDINTLIGLRMERLHVFDATHRRIFEWLDTGILDGVRIDHLDGLRDPKEYLKRLRTRFPQAWIIGEKILEPGELLHEDWPVNGTSGYDFMNACNHLLVDGSGLQEFSAIYADFIGQDRAFDEIAHNKKVDVEQEALGSDVNRLANIFVELCETHRDRRDYTRAEIRRAIREVAASFSVYRTYVVAERNEITEEDREQILAAVAQAKTRRGDIDPDLFDFMGEVLMANERGALESEFTMRFQQFTSPVMAKGVEDTTFYCFNRMIGLNEVGGSPARDGITLQEFHDYCAHMQTAWPQAMTALSTHDTKRCDDVRARLAALTEIPAGWRSILSLWSGRHQGIKRNGSPDRNSEYFLYQTLIGAWPISEDRLSAYMEKAMREAKQCTNWIQPNRDFEDGLRSFIHDILQCRDFTGSLEELVRELDTAGQSNSLAQLLLHCTAPGVPDTFQGGELWDFRLVDPDNRTPVDYDLRRSMLNELKHGLTAEEIMRRADAGMPKLWLCYRALNLRREHPEWFQADACYTPLFATGDKKDHVIAFLRADSVVAIAPRWLIKLEDHWANTRIEIPDGTWHNLLTEDKILGGSIGMREVLRRFPVALLVRESE